VTKEHLPVIAEVAKFCRARQPFCQGGMPVPQVALLYSTASHYREINNLFGRDLSRLSGTLQALVESQQVVDIVGEHSLADRMAEYHLIVVAECDYLDPAFKQRLVRYVENGGNVLLVGPQSASLFAIELDVTLESGQHEPLYLASGDSLVATRDRTPALKLGARAKTIGLLHLSNDKNSAFQPAASVAPLGKGKIAATYFSFSRGYLNQRPPEMRAFLNDLARQLFPQPMVEVKGSPDVDVSVNRLRGQLAINLVNTSGAHWDTKKPLIDSIDQVGPLEISFQSAAKPAKITLQPEGRQLPFEYREGVARLTVPRLEIYSVIVIE